MIKRVFRYNNLIGFLLKPIRKFYSFYKYRLLPEEVYLKERFKKTLGYKLDLQKPLY